MKKTNSISNDDNQLIALIAQGDEKAFSELIKKYQHAVFNTIYRYTGYCDCVEDLAQEIFLKVWRNADKFEGKSKFSTWLYRIVVNHCLNYNSKHKFDQISLEAFTEQGRMPDSLKVQIDREKQQKIDQVKKAVRDRYGVRPGN